MITPRQLAEALDENAKGHGDKWKCRCPLKRNHSNEDKNPSFEVRINSKGKISWECYAGCDWQEITDEITRLGLNPYKRNTLPEKASKPTDETVWTAIVPVPEDAPAPPSKHSRLGESSASWTYRTADGRVALHILRFDIGDGDKEFRPLTFCSDGNGRKEWRWKELPKPWPLYNLDKLVERPDAEVIVCEGEKAADSAAEMFPECVAVASLHGSKSADKADWSPLKGRKVRIWPDADEVGRKYAASVAQQADKNKASSISMLDLASLQDAHGEELDKGFDAYDAMMLCVPMETVTFSPFALPPAQIRPRAEVTSEKEFAGDESDSSEDRKATFGSDLDITQRVIAHYGRENLMADKYGLYRWNEKCWVALHDKEIERLIIDTYALNWLGDKADGKHIASVLRMIKALCFDASVVFDAPDDLIHCQNGAIQVEADGITRHDHKREHYRTSLLPVTYDEDATSLRTVQFVEEIFEPPADADAEELGYDPKEDAALKTQLFFEALGYTLTNRANYEKYFLLHAGGSNGKSKVIFLLEQILGTHNIAAVDPSQFNNRFQLGGLRAKLANIVPEIRAGEEIDDAFFKKVTSGDPVTAEHKNKDPFQFRPYCTLWLGTNHMPHTRDLSHAFFRRAVILEFTNTFREKGDPEFKPGDKIADVDLEEKLKEEINGAFLLSLYGLSCLKRRGSFLQPPSSIAAKKKWKFDCDQAAQMVAECCDIGPELSCAASDLYNAYRLKWAPSVGISKILSQNSFARRLSDLGYKRGRKTDERLRLGLELKPEWRGITSRYSFRGSHDESNN